MCHDIGALDSSGRGASCDGESLLSRQSWGGVVLARCRRRADPDARFGGRRWKHPVHRVEFVCLAVAGNTATAVGRLAPNPSLFTYAKFTAVDNGPTGDTYGAPAYRSVDAPPCTPITTFEGDASALPQPLLAGDIRVPRGLRQPRRHRRQEPTDQPLTHPFPEAGYWAGHVAGERRGGQAHLRRSRSP